MMYWSRGIRHRRGLAVGLALALLSTSGCDDDETEVDAADADVTEADGTEDAVDDAADDTVDDAAEEGVEGFSFGMILVGPPNDRGWSQGHFEGGMYVEEQLGATMFLLDRMNPAERPELTVEQVVDDMIDQGAQLIIATSEEMGVAIQAAAAAHPDVPMIWSAGDTAWEEGRAYRADLTNLGNVMGRMVIGKMIAGCAAALTTETGDIGYLGPLINHETLRQANAAYLGARYCWESVRGNNPADLGFAVTWIGFWFYIPGLALDPVAVTNEFFDAGADVVISGIDTSEALVEAGARASEGEAVWALANNFEDACSDAPDVCLGAPYLNWGPAYLEIAQSVISGDFEAEWQWLGPDWTDINDRDTSAVGFVQGQGLPSEAAEGLDAFIEGLGDGSINPFVGPLDYQDGTPFLGDGEVATDVQIWYMEQLLEGMEGESK